jgi:hypothetical protein
MKELFKILIKYCGRCRTRGERKEGERGRGRGAEGTQVALEGAAYQIDKTFGSLI